MAANIQCSAKRRMVHWSSTFSENVKSRESKSVQIEIQNHLKPPNISGNQALPEIVFERFIVAALTLRQTHLFSCTRDKMGYKAKNKQAPPRPLPDPDAVRPDRKQKKRKPDAQGAADRLNKKSKKTFEKGSSGSGKQAKLSKGRPTDEDYESDNQSPRPTVTKSELKKKAKKAGGSAAKKQPAGVTFDDDSEPDLDEFEAEDEGDDIPEVQHNFDLDMAPEGEADDLAAFMGDPDADESDQEDAEAFGRFGDQDDDEDEFDLSGDEAGLQHDSAFDTTDDEEQQEDEDDEMDLGDDDDQVVPPHLRPNPSLEQDGDELDDGQITTNLMGDITASEFSLPAVTKSRAKTAEDGDEDDDEEEFDELEGRTSLRDVEARMRWLVGILGGKEKDEDGDVVQGGEFRGIPGL